jgi:hypothetical protein
MSHCQSNDSPIDKTKEMPQPIRTKGSRAVLLEEPEDNSIYSGMIKYLTGGDWIDLWDPERLYESDGCYPSCRYCWNGVIFADGKVFCDKCNISREATGILFNKQILDNIYL